MTAANVKALGPCTLIFNSNNFGDVAEVVVTITNKTNVITEQTNYGDIPVDAVDMGISAMVECVVLEQDLDILDGIPGFTKLIGTASTGSYVGFGGPAGATAITTGSLVVTPKDTAKADLAARLYKAFLSNCAPTIAYNPEGHALTAFQLTFEGMLDTSRTSGDQVGRFGSATAEVA